MPRVIHTGQALVDMVVEVSGLPSRGGNVMAQTAQHWAGGAVTVLSAAARSGATAVHAGAHGTGPHGDLIRSALAQDGIQISQPPVKHRDTGLCVVLVEPSAERTFVTIQGAERDLSVAGLRSGDARSGDFVCLTGYTLLQPTREPLLAWLADLSAGAVVVLDPGEVFADLPGSVRHQVLSRVGVWTSNATEAAAMTGLDDPAASSAELSAIMPQALVVVRDGEHGCHLAHAGGTARHVPGYPQRAVDTNGAGDTHVGAMLAGLAAGLDPEQAARRANAAGAITVTRRGPGTAPTGTEIDTFLAGQDD